MRTLKSVLLVFRTSSISKSIGCCILFLSLLISCSNDKPDKIGAIVDRTKLPKLHATEITTIISDSGITRYRITASRWDIFDKASQPYQEFPDGIYFEKFDANLKVDANIQSKYARFNENEQTWMLRGKVRAMNLQGELFETEKLFWNQRQQKFYSDTLIKITQATRIITGLGFESNESMTNYTIKRPQGTFPLNENASSQAPVSTAQPVGMSSSTGQPAGMSSSTGQPVGISSSPVRATNPKTTFPPVKSTPVIAPFHKTSPQNKK